MRFVGGVRGGGRGMKDECRGDVGDLCTGVLVGVLDGCRAWGVGGSDLLG